MSSLDSILLSNCSRVMISSRLWQHRWREAAAAYVSNKMMHEQLAYWRHRPAVRWIGIIIPRYGDVEQSFIVVVDVRWNDVGRRHTVEPGRSSGPEHVSEVIEGRRERHKGDNENDASLERTELSDRPENVVQTSRGWVPFDNRRWRRRHPVSRNLRTLRI